MSDGKSKNRMSLTPLARLLGVFCQWLFFATKSPCYLLSVLLFLGGITESTAVDKTQDYIRLLRNDAISIPQPLLRMIEQTTPIPMARGMIESLEKRRSVEDATITFCATALQQKGEQYASLIWIMHEELITGHSVEEGAVRGRNPRFLESSEKPENRKLFTLCLEHGAPSASPETLYRLFQVENGMLPPPSPNAYGWLIAAAKGGSVQAQYVFAKSIWDWSRRPAGAPAVVSDYINPDAYHRFMRQAAEGGHRLAQAALARFYLDRFPMNPKNVEHVNVAEGLRWLKILAGQTDDLYKRYKAISEIGALYLNGTIVPENPVTPVWPGSNLRSRDEKVPNNTLEIQVDYVEALKWFHQIPEEELGKYCGTVSSMRDIYRLGLGVKVDLEKAARYQSIFTTACIKV